MQVTFLGATETVTGSRFLVEAGRDRVLVDCGLFQGVKALRQRNWEPPPVDPRTLTAVVLTHAHIDHSGYLPALVRSGFRGPVLCSTATAELCGLLLPDAGYLQEEEARYLNKGGRSRHKPALPLFTAAEAEASLERLRPIPFHHVERVGQDMELRLTRAGHIIGSACVHLTVGGKTICFTGDVGRPVGPVMLPPEPLGAPDWLVMESTYGNRRHDRSDPGVILGDVIRRTAARGGVVVIPAFAVGRTQSILYLLSKLREEGEIPDLPVFLDSPMAIEATRLFCEHAAEHRLTEEEVARMDDHLTCVRDAEHSKALNRRDEPCVIVSASGMATGGRVLHHLKHRLPKEKNTVLFVGFQAAGTRGESLLSGSDQIKIHGEYVPVRAEIARIDSLSVHADYVEMTDWLRSVKTPPRRVFLVHGEPAAQDSLRRYLSDLLGWSAEIPRYGDRVELT